MELSPTRHVDTFARDNLPPAECWPDIVHDPELVPQQERINCAEQLLDRAVALYGRDRPCLVAAEETWTYGYLLDKANQIAQVLTDDLGVVPGNRVLLRGPNNPWVAACWFGIIKAGGIAVTVLPVLRAAELAHVVASARIRHALCDSRSVADVVSCAELTTATFGDGDLERRCAWKPAEYTNVDTAADDVSLIAYTSGTTGVPKGCVHFHRDVLTVADTFAAYVLEASEDDVFVGTPALGFTFGLGALVVFPVRAGASSVLLEKPDMDALLSAVERNRVSVLFTAPTGYRKLLGRVAEYDTSSLRRCVSAGEHLDRNTWQEWRDATGLVLVDGIGSTEMLHIFISSSPDEVKPGATGRPVPGFEARTLDSDGRVVQDGKPGYLAVRGPIGCRYLADERQRDYVRGGWNITGDVYVRDGDGYFWFHSRADDLIVSAGHNIAAAEVETAIRSWPGAADTAVVGVPDADRGQQVKAYVVLAEGYCPDDVMARSLVEFVRERIAPYKCPRSIEFISQLPRTATEKVQRFRLGR